MAFTDKQTIVDIAREKAERLASKVAYINLQDNGQEQRRITYAQIDAACRRIGSALQSRNLRGERVVLLLPQGIDFITGFFGTLYGGAIAVPAHAPRQNARSWATFQAIVDDCGPKLILTSRAIRDKIVAGRRDYPSVAALELLCIEDVEAESRATDWVSDGASPAEIAFLQYTSGSTSKPKGVMVSHGNLIHNASLTARHMGHDGETVIVSWLPLFHDLGLIGIVIQTLYIGATCYMMSPASFSGSPALWLQAISRYRATTSMSSDFGYRLCVKSVRPEQLEGVDLSSWRNALNAAEPIHASTLRSFQERFGPFGFASDAFFPAYGLAEATLLSTTSRVGERPVILAADKAALSRGEFVPANEQSGEVIDLVSSGRPADDMEVLIVDPDTFHPVRDGQIGEVWVRGASIAQGYWQAPDPTRQTFRQSPADRAQPEFLRTGDLGLLWNAELFVAGRLKDLIILRGRNIYPQDIELTVKDSHPAFRTVNGAAFSVDDKEGESIVVVQEIERTARKTTDLGELEKSVRQAVWQEHDITLADVVFIAPASLPKTTSGKVQRRLTKSIYLQGELTALQPKVGAAEPPPALPSRSGCDLGGRDKVELEALILSTVQSLTAPSAGRLSASESFGSAGVDSVVAAQLTAALSQQLGIALEPTVLWQYQTPELLAAHLAPAAPPVPDGNRKTAKAAGSRDDLIAKLRAALLPEAVEEKG